MHTPDNRYIIVNGRLWRAANPGLPEDERRAAVQQLMRARREVRAAAGKEAEMIAARRHVDIAKRRLGERGPVWWLDGAPDYNRHLVKNTPYAAWFAAQTR